MQCPACNHIPLAGNQPDPNVCPKCFVSYADSIRAKATQAARQKTDTSNSNRADSLVAPHVRKIMSEYKGAQPVVVLDVNMSFNSMVLFMIKWAIAAIPALVILLILAWGAGAILNLVGIFGGSPPQ